MIKWLAVILMFILSVLYFSGTLEIDTSGDKVGISFDKSEAEELKETIEDKI